MFMFMFMFMFMIMFMIMILGAMNYLSDDRFEYMTRDRYGRQRFPGLVPGETMPDWNVIRPFRQKLAQAGAFEKFFEEFGKQFNSKVYDPRGGQIAETMDIFAPRLDDGREKYLGHDGESAAEI